MADHEFYAPLQPEFRFSAEPLPSEPLRMEFFRLDPSRHTVAVLRVPKTATQSDIHHLAEMLQTLGKALNLEQVVMVHEDAELTFHQFNEPVVPVVDGKPVTE